MYHFSFLMLFALSGFAGLIYESIWTNYFKLFLGHAAYAQVLVLVIFMGGMTLGAAFIARYSHRIKNLLFAYMITELLIGLQGLSFHKVFTGTLSFAYADLLPHMGSAGLAQLAQWSLAALLILPQSILLGATFPMMSGGLLRLAPEVSGQTIAHLYYYNSLGGAIGIIVAGFQLVPWVGLPGTVMTAGLCNIIVAGGIWLLIRRQEMPLPDSIVHADQKKSASYSLILCAALITGFASFLYEIGWVRMLGLVLGASTHAFELMLSAFIFGLAFGSLSIKNRMSIWKHPLRNLGFIQVIMAFFALMTLVLYNDQFNVMQYFLLALSKTNEAYHAFNLASHGICLFFMVPTTFCAGMTLPLMTHILLREGSGEAAVGRVYAANTVGAILGIIVAVHFIMPHFGLKAVIGGGAALDLGLGVFLLYVHHQGQKMRPFFAVAATSLVGFTAVLMTTHFDLNKMSSGIFRYRAFPVERKVIFHQDGKTASVDVLELDHGNAFTISTNGKPDASISVKGAPTSDEATQLLLALLPWSIHPHPQTAAVIGLGAGMSTHTLLEDPNLQYVDTVEIERAMFKGAEYFKERVGLTFTDPRSHIFIEDAKAFFAAGQKKYDLIVSEPSNPWVSGVSSLFTEEFYERVKHHLNPQGLFTQWLHLYEISPVLLGSVMKALGQQFPEYHMYLTNDGDVAIIASLSPIPAPSDRAFGVPVLKTRLNSLGIENINDLIYHKLGEKKFLSSFFNTYPSPVNSDFFPYLDLNAVQARFQNLTSYEVLELKSGILPIVKMLDPTLKRVQTSDIHSQMHFALSQHARRGFAILEYIEHQKESPTLEPHFQLMIDQFRSETEAPFCGKDAHFWLTKWHYLMEITLPHLEVEDMHKMWENLNPKICEAAAPDVKLWLKFYEAWLQQKMPVVHALAKELMELPNQAPEAQITSTGFYMLTQLQKKDYTEVIEAVKALPKMKELPPQIRLMVALAVERGEGR